MPDFRNMEYAEGSQPFIRNNRFNVSLKFCFKFIVVEAAKAHTQLSYSRYAFGIINTKSLLWIWSNNC